MVTNLHLGARVEGLNGDDLGRIKFLVADPGTNQVTHLVVERGMVNRREVVVEVGRVQGTSADGKTVKVDLSKSKMDELPDFVEREYSNMGVNPGNTNQADTYVNTGAATAFPGSNISPWGSFIYPVAPTPDPVAAVPGGGSNSNMGNNTSTPMNTPRAVPVDSGLNDPATGAYNEKMNVPENSLIIREGAEVTASDGKVGRVKQVNLDPASGRIASFTIEKGHFFPEELVVPVEAVESSSDKSVQLKVSKAELSNSPQTGQAPGQ